MTRSAENDDVTHDAGPANHAGGYPGVVAGVVLRSARLSAGISTATLATASGVSEEAIEAWEQGSSPLASVPLAEVEALAASLREAGACPDIVADLAAAAWCDLVILAIANHEDPECLMADPTTSEPAFCELLTWSIAGQVPDRYRSYAVAKPLLTDSAVIRQMMHRASADEGHRQ